jgi:hypothetical protein
MRTLPEQSLSFPRIRKRGSASRSGPVKAALARAPKGSLDGWPRCSMMSERGNGRLFAHFRWKFQLCSNRKFLLCCDITQNLVSQQSRNFRQRARCDRLPAKSVKALKHTTVPLIGILSLAAAAQTTTIPYPQSQVIRNITWDRLQSRTENRDDRRVCQDRG